MLFMVVIQCVRLFGTLAATAPAATRRIWLAARMVAGKVAGARTSKTVNATRAPSRS
jgi:hypothetical protein